MEHKPNFTAIAEAHFERVGRREDKRENDLEVLAYRKGYIDAYNVYAPVSNDKQSEELIRMIKYAYLALNEIHHEPSMSGSTLHFKNRLELIKRSADFYETLDSFCSRHPELVDSLTRKP